MGNTLVLCIFLFSREYQWIVFIGEHAGCYLVISIEYSMYSGTTTSVATTYLMMGNWMNTPEFLFVSLHV